MPRTFAKLLLLVFALPAVVLAAPARAGSGAEAVFDHSTVRLVDGGVVDGRRLAGVDVRLGEGWKTYWKVPGDSGTPPVFDWSKSRNLKRATVLWPAPARYADPETGETIGYKGRVVFPVVVEPEDPSSPVVLHLVMDYALCNEMCIPARAEVERVLTPVGGSGDAGLVRKWLERVPGPPREDFRVVDVRLRGAEMRPRLLVTVLGKGLDERTEIFVEGPPLASFCHPRFVSSGDGRAVYYLPVDGISDVSELKGEKLRLTVISGERRIEQEVELP